MDQQQSLLFRLPRELRDKIYDWYLREEGGYVFSLSAQRFRQPDGRSIDLTLGYTCKRLAAEIDGYALRENTLRFRVLPQTRDTTSQSATAYMFALLLEWRGCYCEKMLRLAYWLVSPEAMQEVRSKHPGNSGVKQLEQKIVEHGNALLFDGYLPDLYTLDYFVQEIILHDLIQAIAKHADFQRLTSREYDPDVDIGKSYVGTDADWHRDEDAGKLPLYTRETQFRVINWRPALWWIPDQQDLDEVTTFLSIEPDLCVFNSRYAGPRLINYFSAAAAAIQRIERFTPKNRMHLRKIVIQEDHKSVGLPKIHARGLVPFCVENPQLRVERRVDIWRTELIPATFGVRGITQAFRDDALNIAKAVAEWICEAKYLRTLGMPTDSFSLVLHGPSEGASQQLCDAMIGVAIWHDGAEKLAQREGEELDYEYGDGISEDFVALMKSTIRGDIPARFEADMGEVWDIEEILRDRGDDWPDDMTQVFAPNDFEEPDGGWEAARAGYYEEVEMEKNQLDAGNV